MNATMVESGTKAVPPVVSSIQEVPLAKIRESKTNPRRQFDESKLAELAENIRQHGVLQPILLRPLPEGEAGTYELVAGTRRYRASKLAKRESIPATVRELTDAQALELQVIELSVVRNSFLCWIVARHVIHMQTTFRDFTLPTQAHFRIAEDSSSTSSFASHNPNDRTRVVITGQRRTYRA
jgi:ParB-like nuclease family protein